MRLTLKFQAALVATLVVAALLGVFALTQRGKFQADIQALLRQHQQALVHEAATDLRERLDEYLGLVQRTAAQAGHVNFASPQEALRYFNSISPVSTLFDGMFIVGLDGRISASFPHVQGVVGLDVHDRDYFKEVVIVGQPTISSPLRNRVGGAPNIVFAAPIFDDAGRITGVFCASLGLLRPNFLGDLRNMRIGANGYVFVVQRGNHPMFVIHPDDNKLLAETTIEPAIANALAEMPTDDTGPLVITENIIATGWTLGSVIPRAEVNAPFAAIRARLGWAVGLLAVLMAFSVWGAMQLLLRPLARLHAALMKHKNDSWALLAELDVGHASPEITSIVESLRNLIAVVVRQRAELEAVNDASPLGLFRTGKDGSTGYVNDAYCRILGLTKDEALANAWRERLVPEDRERAEQAWRVARENGTIFRDTQRVRVPGESERQVSVTAAPVTIDGKVRGYVGAVEDITQRVRAERELGTLMSILEATPDFIAQADRHGRLTYINPAGRRFAGVADDADITRTTIAEYHPPHIAKLLREVAVPAALKTGVWSGETLVYDAHRQAIPMAHTVIVHRDAAGQLDHYSAIMRDIRLEKAAKESIERTAATLQTVTDAIPGQVAFIDAAGCYEFVNAAYERDIGMARQDLIGKSVAEVVGLAAYARIREPLEKALRGEPQKFETEEQSGGALEHEEVQYIPQFRADGSIAGVHIIVADITARKENERRLQALSLTDHLTGLLNRAGFEAQFEHALRTVQAQGAVALFLVDLDDFKRVNDTYGHATGDEVLKAFADRLRTVVRPTDSVARFGGDEFALIVHVSNEETVHTLARRLTSLGARPYKFGQVVLQLGCSVGVARFEQNVERSVIFSAADEALYRAKALGKGRYEVAEDAGPELTDVEFSV